MDVFSKAVFYLVPLILSLTVHEFAHAWAAKKLGDDTAERLGRLTLNPLSHIDLVGTIILPILLIMKAGVPFFAWAKPVPFEASRFRRDINIRTGTMLVAFAGPLSNLALLLIAASALSIAGHLMPPAFVELSGAMMTLNAGLFALNLIPMHPLDGGKVLAWLLPSDLAARYDNFFYQYGGFMLLPLFFVIGPVLRPIIGFLIRGVAQLTGLA